jgi:hypothetical protein
MISWLMVTAAPRFRTSGKAERPNRFIIQALSSDGVDELKPQRRRMIRVLDATSVELPAALVGWIRSGSLA